MSVEDALQYADSCDEDDELIVSYRRAFKTLAAELRGIEPKIVAAIGESIAELRDETERAKVIGKRITPHDVAAICAGAARFAAILETKLGIAGADNRGIRTILSQVKLKMGVIVS